jgi:hypothetical protein
VIQVQGKDMGGAQLSRPWARPQPVSAAEGRAWLAELQAECSRAQRKEREKAFKKAIRFINQVEQLGGVTPEAQPQSFRDPRSSFSDARVDIEIRTGRTFLP